MDGQKFDELVKQFCTTRLTRLSALRGLVAGVAATVTGSTLIADDADAKKGRGGAKAENKKKGRGAQDEGKGGKKGGAKKGRGKKGGSKKKGDAKKKRSQNKGSGGQSSQGDNRLSQQSHCPVPTSSGVIPGNSPECGIRLEEGRDFTQGQDTCDTITHDCGNGTTCTIEWCLSDGTRTLSFGPFED